MRTTLQPLSVHYDPPVTDVHVMLKRLECEMGVWTLTKRSQGKIERHLYILIK